MADVIFNTAVGRGAAISGFDHFPIVINIPRVPGVSEPNFTGAASKGTTPYNLHNVIITSVGTSQGSNFQFMQTLQDNVYVYVFGDKLGELRVSGLVFAGKCSGGADSGFSKLLSYYTDNKVSNKTKPGVPMQLTIGKTKFSAFLVNAQTSIDRPVEGLGQFTLSFVTVDMH